MSRPSSRPRAHRNPGPKRAVPVVQNLWLVPAAILAVLSLPGFQFPYLFDDFDFLGDAQRLTWTGFLPDPEVIFWRPLSREVYFGLLYALRDAGPAAGHAISIACLMVATYLIVRIGTSLGSRKAGLMAGLVFASFSQLPFLAAWLSGSQDLLAILFILLAIDLRERHRLWLSAGALVLGLLSKEISVAFVPLLIGFDWLLGRKPNRLGFGAALYGGIAIVWAAIHPGIHTLLRGGLRNSPGGYVGLDIADRVTPLWMGAITSLNLPVSGLGTPLSGLPWLFLGVALTILGVFWRYLRSEPSTRPGEEGPSIAAIVRVGAVACILPAVMTHAVVRNWAVYYTCVSFAGIALVAGGALSRLPFNRAMAVVALLLVAGFWSRNMVLDPESPSERNLKPAASALRSIEAGLRSLNRRIPSDTDLLVSIQSAGAASAYVHLYRFQAPRVWYHDATLATYRPDFPISGSRPKRLFWVDPAFEVYEIDLASLKSRPPAEGAALEEYKKTVRYYARGLAAGGDVLRAAIMVLQLPEDDAILRNIDVRTAAMAFAAQGKHREADVLLKRTPPLPVELRLAGMGAVLASTPGDPTLDEAAFKAFDLSPEDPVMVQRLGQRFSADRRHDLAARFGERLLRIDPNNALARQWIRHAQSLPPNERITKPVNEGIRTPFPN